MFLSAFCRRRDGARRCKALGAVAYLVKPLDIGQIVPAVEAAFANALRGRTQPPAPAQRRRGHAAAAPADPVPLAVGVLMHRYSLPRADALAAAAAHGRRRSSAAMAEQAERLVSAVEELARPGTRSRRRVVRECAAALTAQCRTTAHSRSSRTGLRAPHCAASSRS